jgi:hypothetical protein
MLGDVRLDMRLDGFVRIDNYEKKLISKLFINLGEKSNYSILINCYSKVSQRLLYSYEVNIDQKKAIIVPIELEKLEVADGMIKVDCNIKVLEYRNVKKTRQVKTKEPSSLGNLFGLFAGNVYVDEDYYENDYCFVAEKQYSLIRKICN